MAKQSADYLTNEAKRAARRGGVPLVGEQPDQLTAIGSL
jgi:hypothetical protein